MTFTYFTYSTTLTCVRVIWTADIGAEFGHARPLDEARIHTLSANGGEVLDRIIADSVFVTELANVGCISWSQRDHLNNIIQPRDRNEKLTEFLTRRSVADFQKFIRVLAKEHDFLVPVFLTGEGELFSTNLYVRGGWKSKLNHLISLLFIFIKFWPAINIPHRALFFYLRQVNGVNGGGTVYVRCVSVCVSVHSRPVNQTSLKR